MTSDQDRSPTKGFGDSKENMGEQKPRLTSDLKSTDSRSKNDDSRQSTSQNSPTKRSGNESSPTKSRNRRKNDSRRRSGSHKKQAATDNEQSERQSQIPKLFPSNSSETDQQQQGEFKRSNNDEINLIPETNEGILDNDNESHSKKNHSEDNDKSSNIISQPKHSVETKLLDDHKRAYKELAQQNELQNHQIQRLVNQTKQQMGKVKELETALLSTTRTCNQLEKLLQQELSARTRLEAENESLNQSVARLKLQLSVHEKNKFNNDELMRVLNATLMERETEVSILKLKLTRMQTNPSSNIALNSASSVSSVKHQDPSQFFTTAGRSNSEFNRNSYIRSSMIAEAASVRASTSQLRSVERDASVWATVPEELTPSKRPQLLDRSFQPNYGDAYYNPYNNVYSSSNHDTSTPLVRDRRYKTLPRSMRSPSQEFSTSTSEQAKVPQSNKSNLMDKSNINVVAQPCQVTNLDDSSSTNQSGNKTGNSSNEDSKNILSFVDQTSHHSSNKNGAEPSNNSVYTEAMNLNEGSTSAMDSSHYSTISKTNINSKSGPAGTSVSEAIDGPPSLPMRTPTTPVKFSKMKKILDKFRRSDSSTNSNSKTDLTISPAPTPTASPFRRGANRSTMVGAPNDIRSQMSPMRQAANFQTDKPFDEWDTDMLVDWLTMIGLSMYTVQCRRWVKCGAHIMNATPAEVDKGLGITNHLHRKKLRLAISELNGDCDKITKAAARLDYLWVARWLDDIGLPQHKEAFINARVDGRVLNYLTVEDLISMNVKSVLHHASIRCGIRVLRSIHFDVQLLKRRATADEIEQMNTMSVAETSLHSKTSNDTKLIADPDVSLWTCHRVMEWLRLIDFAEFAPNLRGSGVHGGLIVFEDGFNSDTLCSLLSIPMGSTLLRRHLSTYFKGLIGSDLVQRKMQYKDAPSNQQLNPLAEIKTPKKSQLWSFKLKSSKVSQDGMDEYLCPMYPVEPQITKNLSRTIEPMDNRESSQLPKIPESINV